MIGSMSSAEPLFHTTICSTAPRPHDARKIAVKFSIRPMTAAVSARKRIDGPNAGPSGSPMMPARRMSDTVASTVAIIHAMLWVNPTLTPRSDARSELSELARNAMPMLVNRRNAHSPTMARSVVRTATSSLAWKIWGAISKLKSNGGE